MEINIYFLMKTTIRNFLGYTIANAMILFGIIKKARHKLQNGDYILSLCFHAPSKLFFESCINWLTKNGFHFISLNDLEKVAKGEIVFPRGAVVITIDDGWQSNFDNIVPIVIKNKIPVTIFVSTEVVEKGSGYWWSYINESKKRGLSKNPVEFFKTIDNEDRLKIIEQTKTQINLNREALTIEQVKQISNNKFVSIGSHSVSHPILPKCSYEKSAFEISQSKKAIEGWTGNAVTHFAYPNGDYTKREIDLLKQNGYTIAFSTEQKYLTKTRLNDLYKLPRLLMLETASFEENICRMMGVWIKKNKAKQTNI